MIMCRQPKWQPTATLNTYPFFKLTETQSFTNVVEPWGSMPHTAPYGTKTTV